jgi:hypothetical protein
VTATTNEARERELARLDALIERWADYLMQGRNGDDTSGDDGIRLYLKQLRTERDALRAEGS